MSVQWLETPVLENEYLSVRVTPKGTLTVLNKETGRTYKDLLVFENVGDVGNEYIFKQPEGTEPILSTDFETAVSQVRKSALGTEVTLSTTMMIPISAEESLHDEQMAIIEFRQRKSKRHEQLAPLVLETKVMLEAGSRQVKFETHFDNKMRDHRLRVLFPTDINADFHVADSIYETVVRSNDVSKAWTNPTNPQHQHTFSGIYDSDHGVTVVNYGLNEYELAKDRNTLAVTLLRATGELGDWGYFATPEAQVQGESTVSYGVSFHGADVADRLRTYRDAQSFQIPFTAMQADIHEGKLPEKHQFMNVDGDGFLLTALKCKEGGSEVITRGYNLTGEHQDYALKLDGFEQKVANLLEEEQDEVVRNTLLPAEIVTHIWK
jgi:alpha-mannosidase/octanoyl-[GcvH]:protein N-octanoyltransferase